MSNSSALSAPPPSTDVEAYTEKPVNPLAFCPVPDCLFTNWRHKELRQCHVNEHLVKDHGVPLERGRGGNMGTLRDNQEAQWHIWCGENGFATDLPIWNEKLDEAARESKKAGKSTGGLKLTSSSSGSVANPRKKAQKTKQVKQVENAQPHEQGGSMEPAQMANMTTRKIAQPKKKTATHKENTTDAPSTNRKAAQIEDPEETKDAEKPKKRSHKKKGGVQVAAPQTEGNAPQTEKSTHEQIEGLVAAKTQKHGKPRSHKRKDSALPQTKDALEDDDMMFTPSAKKLKRTGQVETTNAANVQQNGQKRSHKKKDSARIAAQKALKDTKQEMAQRSMRVMSKDVENTAQPMEKIQSRPHKRKDNVPTMLQLAQELPAPAAPVSKKRQLDSTSQESQSTSTSEEDLSEPEYSPVPAAKKRKTNTEAKPKVKPQGRTGATGEQRARNAADTQPVAVRTQSDIPPLVDGAWDSPPSSPCPRPETETSLDQAQAAASVSVSRPVSSGSGITEKHAQRKMGAALQAYVDSGRANAKDLEFGVDFVRKMKGPSGDT